MKSRKEGTFEVMQVYRNVLSVKEFHMWNELVKHEILFFHHLHFHTNLTKQSTEIEILEKGGQRNPEVL